MLGMTTRAKDTRQADQTSRTPNRRRALALVAAPALAATLLAAGVAGSAGATEAGTQATPATGVICWAQRCATSFCQHVGQCLGPASVGGWRCGDADGRNVNGTRGANYVDADQDGVCDVYELGRSQGLGTGTGAGNGIGFVDDDGDGVCDNAGMGQGRGAGSGAGQGLGAGGGMGYGAGQGHGNGGQFGQGRGRA